MSNSDDGKRMYRVERRAEKKIKDKRRRQYRPFTRGSSQSTFSNLFWNSQRSSAGDHAARKDVTRPSPTFGTVSQEKCLNLFYFSVHSRCLLALFFTSG